MSTSSSRREFVEAEAAEAEAAERRYIAEATAYNRRRQDRRHGLR